MSVKKSLTVLAHSTIQQVMWSMLTHSNIGTDFHRAMVATALGGKLLVGRRPVRNWIQQQYQACFLYRKLHLFLGKSTKCCRSGIGVLTSLDITHQQKLLPPELCFLTPVYTKSFVGWGFAPDPTRRAYSAPQTPLAVFRGLLLKGGERRGGSSYFAQGNKQKPAPMQSSTHLQHQQPIYNNNGWYGKRYVVNSLWKTLRTDVLAAQTYVEVHLIYSTDFDTWFIRHNCTMRTLITTSTL